MGRYTLTRHIQASPERVFEAFTDPALLKDWMDLSDVRDVTGPLDSAGARYRMIVRGPWGFRCVVLESQPPVSHRHEGRGPLGAYYRNTARLVARDGGTDLELETEYVVPLGPIGRLLDRLFVDKEPRAIANRELDRLVEIVSASEDRRLRLRQA